LPPEAQPFKWRQYDTPYTITAQPFIRMVVENDLKTWEADGYIWAAYPTTDGHDLYRTYGPKWRYLYQATRVNTQDNVGGGALYTVISVATGVTAELVGMNALSNGNATFGINLLDEDGVTVQKWSQIGAAAGNTCSLPSIGSTASTSANTSDTKKQLIGPGQIIQVWTGALVQTNTLRVAVALLLPITATVNDITWATTGSGGTPNLAASTISDANTMQAVLLP